jgi:hypothetical protein
MALVHLIIEYTFKWRKRCSDRSAWSAVAVLRRSIGDRSGFGAVGTGIWGPPCWTRLRSPRHDRLRGSGGTCEPKSRSPGERSSGSPELRRSLRHGPAVCACALGETGPSQLGSNRHVTVVHARSVDESENPGLPRKGSGGVRVYVIPLQLSFYLIFAGPAYEPRTVTGLHVTDQ